MARIGSPASKAGSSSTLTVRVTTKIFTVRVAAATRAVEAGSPVVVTGSVTPRTAGVAHLQRVQGQTWRELAAAPGGTLVLAVEQP